VIYSGVCFPISVLVVSQRSSDERALRYSIDARTGGSTDGVFLIIYQV
jgi:hypothetical protein